MLLKLVHFLEHELNLIFFNSYKVVVIRALFSKNCLINKISPQLAFHKSKNIFLN